MSTRILLADDHAIFVEGLCALLDKNPGFEVVGKANCGSRAVRLSRELSPDIVIMDLTMPDMGGVEATLLIVGERPAVKVLCLSLHADRGFVMSALNAGASGYMLKDGATEELIQAIHTVMADQVYLSPAIAGAVVDTTRSKTDVDISPMLEKLTEREREVLKLLAEGESTRDIATRLHLSIKTVGSHRVHIMEKLNTHSIAVLTKFAIRAGLTSSAE